ncbi:hypothetical protein ANCCAN_26840 [Ancylostoma caninum]|uniref:Uncharacterized protein n=1 Tax=Ancylostoma caninum TaxID=29170 RepID=A0A368F982_ANCCA|nr:hypothetical protein ANCCAN_26840 [Ancylostoma caninum]
MLLLHSHSVYTNGGSIVGGRGYKSSGRWQVGIRLVLLSSAVVVRGAPVVSRCLRVGSIPVGRFHFKLRDYAVLF